MSDATTNETAAVPAPEMPSSVRLILTLGLIAMMSGLFIVLTFQITKPMIEKNEQEFLERAVGAVLPEVTDRNFYLLEESGMSLLDPSESSKANVIAGYDAQGTLVGLAMKGEAKGYSDVVEILYGYDPKTENVIGTKVLKSTETPGLGDKVSSDPDFLYNFDPENENGGLDASLNAAGEVANPIKTVKNGKKENPWEIDGISGATITSTAVGNALQESTGRLLPLLAKHRDALALTYER